MNKKEKIIAEWNKTKVVHPSYREIAEKTGSAKSYVFLVINELLKKKPKRGK